MFIARNVSAGGIEAEGSLHGRITTPLTFGNRVRGRVGRFAINYINNILCMP